MSAFRVFAAVYLVMIAMILAAPPIGPEGYSALRRSTSEPAAQNSPNAWVMRAAFSALGASALVAVWPVLRGLPFQRAALLAFAVSVAMTGVVSHAPITPGVPFDAVEGLWHSRFADATGAAFTLLAAATGFVETKGRRAVAFAVTAQGGGAEPRHGGMARVSRAAPTGDLHRRVRLASSAGALAGGGLRSARGRAIHAENRVLLG